MRDFTSELFRREIPRPLHPRPHGRAALVAAGPCAGPAWTSRAEGGAGTSRADAPRIDPAELFRCEIARPLHSRPHGRAALVAAGHRMGPHPPHPRPNPQPPTHGLAREVPEPPSARGVRTGLPRWLALTHEDPDIGRGARPARPSAPHAHARLGCWTPRRAPRRGRAAGDVGPYHCPTRTHLAPTILPPAPTWPLPLSHPHPRRPLPLSHPHPLGPYHCPTRTHLAPTILPPAPTSAPTILPPAPTSASTILPPAPTRSRRWLYNGPAREVPAPPSARGVHSLPPHASTPCASRAPRNSPQKI